MFFSNHLIKLQDSKRRQLLGLHVRTDCTNYTRSIIDLTCGSYHLQCITFEARASELVYYTTGNRDDFLIRKVLRVSGISKYWFRCWVAAPSPLTAMKQAIKFVMASIAFPSLAKKVALSDGTTYGYVHVAPSAATKPNFLLLHGYPSSSYDWRHQISGLQSAGYGLIAPDLLGYGDTDKPNDVGAYRMKAMSGHMIELLDIESIQCCIAVAHDWYGFLPTRFGKELIRFPCV
ncbi:MAG: hypothetical protein Q9187_002017 [Circinaria calcarea]